MTRSAQQSPVGSLLREWRQRRRLSQLDLALSADSSARHLSCVETGRAQPSRAMVLKLCEALEVPLRERNTLLLAGGFAPEYRESSLDDAELAAARTALDAILIAHEPYPAVVVDRYWNVVTTNGAMGLFEDEVPDELLTATPNMYRYALHPGSTSSTAHLVNHRQVREFLLDRLIRQVRATGDPILRDLYAEVSQYPVPPDLESESTATAPSPFAVPLHIRTPMGDLRMFSTMVTFGAPSDVTLSELAIELFYPLDEFTAAALRSLATGVPVRADGAERNSR
ncbi:helix-turn-helix transcriptional regulator [Nocardia uniformis]|uniref:Helix-turn-helix transcriptional regulator n=1 Tax=Nocardia uniformis TaxID=53432 RepID=A0A849CE85_9NOCA|nr:helix-turn-helix transcriptional regulator [Nocardia uniformis]NNH71491.1 helix-turn-helix transcriptional regulator [Nocardia uniformis]